MEKHITRIPQKSLASLQRYSWPGNIRELRNVIERAMILSTGESLVVDLPEEPHSVDCSGEVSLEEFERRYILEILEKKNWKIRGKYGAAEILGLNPSTLYSKMKKLDIEIPRPDE